MLSSCLLFWDIFHYYSWNIIFHVRPYLRLEKEAKKYEGDSFLDIGPEIVPLFSALQRNTRSYSLGLQSQLLFHFHPCLSHWGCLWSDRLPLELFAVLLHLVQIFAQVIDLLLLLKGFFGLSCLLSFLLFGVAFGYGTSNIENQEVKESLHHDLFKNTESRPKEVIDDFNPLVDSPTLLRRVGGVFLLSNQMLHCLLVVNQLLQLVQHKNYPYSS